MTKEDVLPLIFDKIIQEIKSNGGSITTDEFKKLIYNTRLTEDEIINELYGIKIDRDKIKTMLNLIRLTKSDAKDVKHLLKINGYITVERELHKEIITVDKEH